MGHHEEEETIEKKTGVVFAEDLCNEIKTLYEEVRNHKNVDSAWAWNGKIFGKNKSGEIHTIRYGSQLKHMFQDSDRNMNTDELTLEPTVTNREESDWKKKYYHILKHNLQYFLHFHWFSSMLYIWVLDIHVLIIT